MFDYHVHSSFSADSSTDMDKICIKAVKQGLSEICFTEHLDIDYPYDENFTYNFKDYDDKINIMKEKYPMLSILRGCEAGIQKNTCIKTYNALVNQNLDFIIASVHVINGMDPYYKDYYKNKSKKSAYSEYVDVLYETINLYKTYSVIGHIGYVAKFAPYDDVSFSYDDYHEKIDQILRTVIETGHGIEVNTSGYKNGISPLPNFDIIKRYKELGGSIITIGSDTHSDVFLAYKFHDALELIENAGFKYITRFKKMVPIFEPIKEIL